MAFGSWPVSVEFPVHWGDMDSFGHVNNAVYLTWFESARIAYFREIRQEIATPDGVGPILAHMEIDYHLPVEYPDTVRCEATVTSLGNPHGIPPSLGRAGRGRGGGRLGSGDD